MFNHASCDFDRNDNKIIVEISTHSEWKMAFNGAFG